MLRNLIYLFSFLVISLHSHAQNKEINVINLDSLSVEDSLLLEEFKDEFLAEVKDIRSAFSKNKGSSGLDSTINIMNRSSHVEIGLDIAGPIYSNGRETGISGAAFYPSLMYYHKTGFYASAGMSFFTDSFIRKSSPIPALSITPGFFRTFFKRWSVGVHYTRSFPFYAGSFERGLLNNTFSFQNSFDFWNYLQLSLNATISWSSNLNSKKYKEVTIPGTMLKKRIYYSMLTKDLGQGFCAGISILLRKEIIAYSSIKGGVLSVAPSFQLQFGNDNSAYILRGIINGRPQPIQSDRFFGLLNLQPGLTAGWRITNFELYANVNVAIPFNEFDDSSLKRIRNPKQYLPFGEGGLRCYFKVKKLTRKRS